MKLGKEISRDRYWLGAWCIATLILLGAVCFYSVGNDRNVAINTLCLGVATAAIAIPFGVLSAWAATGRGIFSRVLFGSLIGLLIVPAFIHVSAWDSAFGRLGWLTAKQGETLKPLVSGWTSAIWIHAVALTPQIATIFLIGLATGRRVYEEQALLDSSRSAVFWHITFPRMAPLLLLCAVWCLVNCSREIAVTDIYRIGTLAEQVYLGFSMGQFSSIQGSWTQQQLSDAQSLGPFVTISIVGWIVFTALWLFSSVTNYEFESSEWNSNRHRPGQRKKNWLKTMWAIAALFVLAIIPVGNLFYRASFYVASIDGKPVPSHSFAQIASSLRRVIDQYPNEFCWSSLIAVVAASIIMVYSISLVWQAQQSKFWKTIFILILTICFAIPGPLFGSWMSQGMAAINVPVLNWLFDRTIFAPVVASMFFSSPIAILIVWFVLNKTARDCLDSAILEGATKRQQLFRIVLPGKRKALFGCWLIAFALCFGELSTSQMVLPAGMDTVPRTTLGLLHAGVDEMTAALTIVTIGLIIALSCAGWMFIWLNPGQDGQE